MKTTLIALFAAVFLTGCFAPYKNQESLHEKKFHKNGQLAYERMRDRSRGGSPALFVDPKVAQINSEHVNQAALGGGSRLKVGEVTGTNRPDAIDSTGGAVGDIAGGIMGVPRVKIPLKPPTPAVAPSLPPPAAIPGEQVVRIGAKVYKREPDIYGLDGKLFRFDGEKMTPLQ